MTICNIYDYGFDHEEMERLITALEMHFDQSQWNTLAN